MWNSSLLDSSPIEHIEKETDWGGWGEEEEEDLKMKNWRRRRGSEEEDLMKKKKKKTLTHTKPMEGTRVLETWVPRGFFSSTSNCHHLEPKD